MVAYEIYPASQAVPHRSYVAGGPIDFATWLTLAQEMDTEILFIDPRKKRVRHLLKNETGYNETFFSTGTLRFDTVPGFHIEVEWLFLEEKPDALALIQQLVAEARASDKAE